MTLVGPSLENARMRVHLKVLHLRRALTYRSAQLEEASLDDAVLERFARKHGETLLALSDDELVAMTEDGPKIAKMPRIAAIYLVSAASSMVEIFELAPDSYLFFQWRMNAASSTAENDKNRARPFWVDALEEVARETWWQGIPLEGRWYLRLVPEDGGAAFQILRSARS